MIEHLTNYYKLMKTEQKNYTLPIIVMFALFS